jgi:hypothetical protein
MKPATLAEVCFVLITANLPIGDIFSRIDCAQFLNIHNYWYIFLLNKDNGGEKKWLINSPPSRKKYM